jgi:hypothetical protein
MSAPDYRSFLYGSFASVHSLVPADDVASARTPRRVNAGGAPPPPGANSSRHLTPAVAALLGANPALDGAVASREARTISLGTVAHALGLEMPSPPRSPPAAAGGGAARAALEALLLGAPTFSELLEQLELPPLRGAPGGPPLEVVPPPVPGGAWHEGVRALAAARAEAAERALAGEAARGGARARQWVEELEDARRAGAYAAARGEREWALAELVLKTVELALARGGGGGGGGGGARFAEAPLPPAALAALAPLCPTANEEDTRAKKSDEAFAKHLLLCAAKEPREVPHMIRRHVLSLCRVAKGEVWREATGDGEAANGAPSLPSLPSLPEGGGFAPSAATAAAPPPPLPPPPPPPFFEQIKCAHKYSGNHSVGAKVAAWCFFFERLHGRAAAVGRAPLDAPPPPAWLSAALSVGGSGGGALPSERRGSVQEASPVGAASGFKPAGPGAIDGGSVPPAALAAAVADFTAYAGTLHGALLARYPFLRGLGGGAPPPPVALRLAVEEALHCCAHDTLFAAFAGACRGEDSRAAPRLRAAAARPPAQFGLSGAFSGGGGAGAALAARIYAPVVRALRLLLRLRTPLGKLGALRAAMGWLPACAAAEGALERRLAGGGAVLPVSPRPRLALSPGAARAGGSSPVGGGSPAGSPPPARAPPASPPPAPAAASPPRSGAGSHLASPAFGPIGADEMMPRLCFSVSQAWGRGDVEAARPFANVRYVEECMPQAMAMGEDGYNLCSLRGALQFVVEDAETTHV